MRSIFLKIFFFLFLFVIILVSIHWRSASEDDGYVSWENVEQWNNKEIRNEFQTQTATLPGDTQVSVLKTNVTSSPISPFPIKLNETLTVQANVTAGSSYEAQSGDTGGKVDWTFLAPALERGSNGLHYGEQENTADTSITFSYLASSFQLETDSNISAIKLGFNNSQELNIGQKSFTVYLSSSLTEYSGNHIAKWDVDTYLWDYTNILDTKDMVLHHSDIASSASISPEFGVQLIGNMTYYVILSSSSMMAIDTRVKDQESVRNISTSTDGMVWIDQNSERELDITLLSTNRMLKKSIKHEVNVSKSTVVFSASGLDPGNYIAYGRYVDMLGDIAPSFDLIYIRLVAVYVYNSSLEVTKEGNPSNFVYYDLVKISGNITPLVDNLSVGGVRLVIQYRQMDSDKWMEIIELNSSEQGKFEVQWRLQVVRQIVIRVYNEKLDPANKTIEVEKKQVKLWTNTVVQAEYKNNNDEKTVFEFRIGVRNLMDENLSEELLDLIDLKWQRNDQVDHQESSSEIIEKNDGIFSFILLFELDVGTHNNFLGITMVDNLYFSLEEQVSITLIVEKGNGKLQVINNTGGRIDQEIRWEGFYNVSEQILNFSLTTNNVTITNISINGSIYLTENPDSSISLEKAVNDTLTIDFKSLVSQLLPDTNYTLQLHFNNSRYETDVSFNFTMLYPEVSLILHHSEPLEAEYGDTINITLQVNDSLFNNSLEGIVVEASVQLINGSQVNIEGITNQSGFVLFSIQLYDIHANPSEMYEKMSLKMMFQTNMGSSTEGITYSESHEKVLTVEILKGSPGIYFASIDNKTIYAGDRFTLDLRLCEINILSTHGGIVTLYREYSNGTSVEIAQIEVLDFVRVGDCDVFSFTHYEEYMGEYVYIAKLTGNENWKVNETRLPMITIQKGKLLLDLQVDKRLQPKVEHPVFLDIYWNTSNSSQIGVNRTIQSVNLTIYFINSSDMQEMLNFTTTGSKRANETEVGWIKLPSLIAGNYNIVITVEEVGNDGWNTTVLKYQVSVGYYLSIQQELNVTGNSINYLQKISVMFTIEVLKERGPENLSLLPKEIELLIITEFEGERIIEAATATLQSGSRIYKGVSHLIDSESEKIETGAYEIYAILKKGSADYFQLEYEKEMIEIKALNVSLSSDTYILVEAGEETTLTLSTDISLSSNISVEVSYIVEENVKMTPYMVTNGTLEFLYSSMDAGERQIMVSSMDPGFNLNETLDVRVYSRILSLNVSIVSGEYQLVDDGIQFEFQIINQDGELEDIDLRTVVRLTYLSDEGGLLKQTTLHLEERERELTFSPESAGTYKIAIELMSEEIDDIYSKYVYPANLDFQVELRPINIAQREYEDKVSIYFTDGIREADIPIQNIMVMIDERQNGFLIRTREMFSESGLFNFSYPQEGVEYSITIMFAGNNIYQSVESTLLIEGAGINSMQTQSLQQSNVSSMESNSWGNQIYATIGLGIAAVIVLMVTPPVIKKIVNKRGKRRD